MRSFDWSQGLSRAYHEAGHVVAAHCLGVKVTGSSLYVAGGGGNTRTEEIADKRAKALIFFAGIHCQTKFDERHETTFDWEEERHNDWHADRCEVTAAAKLLSEQGHGTTESEVYAELSEESRRLIQSDDNWSRIVRIADALYDKVHLSEEEILRLLNED